jgi:hypothetical protein
VLRVILTGTLDEALRRGSPTGSLEIRETPITLKEYEVALHAIQVDWIDTKIQERQ